MVPSIVSLFGIKEDRYADLFFTPLEIAVICCPMTRDPNFKADLARYPTRPFLNEQSIWAICIYRLGRRIFNRNPGPLRYIQMKFYSLIFRTVETLTGISLPPEAQIGPGLRIYHFGNIFVHPRAVIGHNCTLRQGVTIGNVGVEGPVPIIEDDVEFGAYAQVFGDIRIGRGAKIGAMSVVLCDVPPAATAFGNPARILPGRPNREVSRL
jgi:serine O-acetyltransferase